MKVLLNSNTFLCLWIFMFPSVESAAHPCDRSCDSSQPMTCQYEFTLEWYATLSKACYDCPIVRSDCFREHCIPADGFPRAITVANRQLPGPTITVCQNDTIEVKVRNMLDNNEGTTIHWHGIYQRGSQWMDGVPMITQCPIPSRTSFTYKFLANPAGTHWWHAHAGFHRSDGVAGSLVVKSTTESNPHSQLYDIDNENYTVLIGDWLHQTTMEKYVQHHHSDGSNKGEGLLINGKGEFTNYTKNGTTYNVPLTEFAVEKNTRYRFRIINNAAVFCPFELTIDQHVMTVIATDGVDVTPLNVTLLVVHGGERFDFVLTANQDAASYWFNVQGMADCKFQSQKAILRYSTVANDVRPTSSPISGDNSVILNTLNQQEGDGVLFVTNLSTVYEQDQRLKGTPDDVYYLGFDFKKVDNSLYHDPDLYPIHALPRDHHLYTPQINNVSFVPPHSPLLTQPNDVDQSVICDTTTGENVPNTTFRACPHIIGLKKNRLVELVVFDEGVTFNAGHPMHLHGQHFAVVAMDRVAENISLNEVKQLHQSGSIQYKLDRAVMKDTVIIPDGGYAILRFISDNPGVWVFHCHLSFHQEAGMTMAFHVGEPGDVTGIPNNFPRCGDWSGQSGSGDASRLRHSSLILTHFLFVVFYKIINF